jgi:predicted nucleic acid-binding protein
VSRYFVDTSALVKRYVKETGSLWMNYNVFDAAQAVIISRLTAVEMVSALARRHREKTISLTDFAKMRGAFLSHVDREYIAINLVKSIITDAQALLARHELRALDAIQLASALKAYRTQMLTFITADTRLLTAAAAEGLPTDDPNLHP